MEALGRLIDLSVGIAPVQVGGSGATGARVRLNDCAGVTIVVFCGVGTADGDLHIDLQEHNAASSGTSRDLDIIDHYYIKTDVSLDGSATWTRVEQPAASEIDFSNTSAEEAQIVVIEVEADQLSDGYEWISVNIPDLEGSDDKECSVLYILRDLYTQRKAENLPGRL